MKKITLFSLCFLLSICNVMAQKKQTATKSSTTTSTATTTAAKKESTATADEPSQKESAGSESKKEEKINAFSSIDAMVDAPGNERESMSYQEVYSLYKEKIDRIENDFKTKKAGIQKNTAISKEDIQKKIDEYNAYRVQLLTDLFGQKNFIEYENSKKH